MNEWTTLCLVICAYLLGSIPFGWIVGNIKDVDVRQVGSGNIGATNVARNLGKKLGAVVLLLDLLKSALPTLAARFLVEKGECTTEQMSAIAFAAIIGHCFSVWLRFRGGKGVATSLGVFLVIAPVAAGVGIMAFAVSFIVFRVVSVGSLAAAITVPIALGQFEFPVSVLYLSIATAIVIVVKHRGNIVRLVQGKENKY